MAFLGGLSGLGSLAGGINQGIGQGLNINQYLQQQQAQNLAGSILSQAYGGGQANTNLFGGGQTPASQAILGGLGAAGAGAQPISQAPVPGADPGQPGTANANAPNLFGGGQQATPGMSPLAQQQPSLSQPAPPPPQADPSQSGSPTQPFDASGRMAGALPQQMTIPQAIQLARRVAPNANGGQIYRAVLALGGGGMVAGGAMTPYQSAQLARENNMSLWQIENLKSEMEKRKSDEIHQRVQEEKGAKTEARQQAYQHMQIAGAAVTKAETELNNATNDLDKIRNIPPDNLTDDDKARASALPAEISRLKAQRNRAQRSYDAAEKEYEGGGESAGGGGGGGGGGAEGERTQDLANAKQYIQNGADKEKVIAKIKAKYPDFDPAELGQ